MIIKIYYNVLTFDPMPIDSEVKCLPTFDNWYGKSLPETENPFCLVSVLYKLEKFSKLECKVFRFGI